MRFLWEEYGLTFSNDALMSAVLTVLTAGLPGQSVRKEERASRFRKYIVQAIGTHRISTEHLFAIFLVTLPGLEDRWIHMRGFETVLRYLIDSGNLTALTSNKPFLSLVLSMIGRLQVGSRRPHHTLPDGFAYNLICDLKSLSEQLQPPSQTLSLLIESASLSAIFPNGHKTTFLSGLLNAIEHIRTQIFMFACRYKRDEKFQPPIPSGELIAAEEKLNVLENSALVKEIFTRVRNLLWSTLIR